ncbi:MAG: NCS2 family permease [Clostridia bacterium]|nr:NCS2 family permease [Clostridia bacterium]
MCYIVLVNPAQITGGLEGTDAMWNAVFLGGTLAAIIGTLLMTFLAKMPFAQAASMGLNSFFFVSFVLPAFLNGEDPVTGYQAGLVIILISGIIFMILSATGLREKITIALPDCLKKSMSAGLGLFIALLGFKSAGIIVGDQYTMVTLTDFTQWSLAAPALAAFIGFLILAVLAKKGVKGSIILGILASAVLYYLFTWSLPVWNPTPMGTMVTDFIDVGLSAVFKPESWVNAFSADFLGGIFSAIMLIITFCLVDMFDTVGTLYGAASEANMIDENDNPIRLEKCMLCDSIATLTGAVLGTSTITTFAESSAGVAAGGRTGLTSLVTALCFVVCLFISPIAQLIPVAATAPALIYVGVLMLKNFAQVDMHDMCSAVPAFLTLIMMPLTYSIANGIGIGAIAYVIMRALTGTYTKKDIIVTIVAILFAFRFAFVFTGTLI